MLSSLAAHWSGRRPARAGLATPPRRGAAAAGAGTADAAGSSAVAWSSIRRRTAPPTVNGAAASGRRASAAGSENVTTSCPASSGASGPASSAPSVSSAASTSSVARRSTSAEVSPGAQTSRGAHRRDRARGRAGDGDERGDGGAGGRGRDLGHHPGQLLAQPPRLGGELDPALAVGVLDRPLGALDLAHDLLAARGERRVGGLDARRDELERVGQQPARARPSSARRRGRPVPERGVRERREVGQALHLAQPRAPRLAGELTVEQQVADGEDVLVRLGHLGPGLEPERVAAPVARGAQRVGGVVGVSRPRPRG